MPHPIAGKITVTERVTTVDLHVGAQTVKLTTNEALALARLLSSVATDLHAKIWDGAKPKN